MLEMSDINIEQFLPVFSTIGVQVCFLVPTETGMEKSIMDCIGSVRNYLKRHSVHDYDKQKQGPDYKVMIKAHFITENSLIHTKASLYRPVTKKGDPRIWFYGLPQYCMPYNLLSIIVFEQEIYVINLSNSKIRDSLINKGFVYDYLQSKIAEKNKVADELLRKLIIIHNKGFIPSTTNSDSGVGDTLEHELRIERNSRAEPDYKGIELKAGRLTRGGQRRATTRQTLFSKVPTQGCTYHDILDLFGKYQTPRNSNEERFQIYDTLKCSRPNSYDLYLKVDENNNSLNICTNKKGLDEYVSSWTFDELEEALKQKHHETFWVKAESKMINGWEYFRYDVVEYTKSPNTSILPTLIELDKITLDVEAHVSSSGKYRDHGMLFKIWPDDMPALFGESIKYVLKEYEK